MRKAVIKFMYPELLSKGKQTTIAVKDAEITVRLEKDNSTINCSVVRVGTKVTRVEDCYFVIDCPVEGAELLAAMDFICKSIINFETGTINRELSHS